MRRRLFSSDMVFPSVAQLQNCRRALLQPIAAGDPHGVEPAVLAAMNGDRDNGLSVLLADQPLGVFKPAVQAFAEFTRAVFDGDNQRDGLSGSELSGVFRLGLV